MTKEEFKVSGMHCPSCEKILQLDIGDVPGVKAVKANYKTGVVSVDGEGFDANAVKKAIKQNGYGV